MSKKRISVNHIPKSNRMPISHIPKSSHASIIFPTMHPLPQILGAPRLRQDVMAQIRGNPATYTAFCRLNPSEQEAFLDFCMGNRGLKITYDPFFRHIFDPDRHPERLGRLLSALIGQEVKVRKTLSRESMRLSGESSLVIMDILVELGDGRLVTVEMQRVGYEFPIERGFCYGADLLMRQYDRTKKQRGKKFSYRDIRPVYIIVLMEKSPGLFWQKQDQYIHRSQFSFHTGLKTKNIENFIYIALDIFRTMPHNKLTEADAWLYFLASDSPSDILRIIKKYPYFQELYQDIIEFRYHPEELIVMYSKALSIMDKNTVDYMIDELKKANKRQQKKYEKQIRRQAEENKRQVEENKRQVEENKRQVEKIKRQAEENKRQVEEENRILRERLAKYEGAEKESFPNKDL